MIEIIQGDCLDVLPTLTERPMFAYLDPPFMSQERYFHRDGRFAFDDRWRSQAEFARYMKPRLAAVWKALSENGTMVIHTDHRVAGPLERWMWSLGFPDAESRVIWRYRRWPSKTRNFQRVHDVMLRYVKGPGYTFNQLYEPLAESTVKTFGKGKQRAVVVDGRRQKSKTTDEQSPGVPMGDVWDLSIIAPGAKERTGYPTQKPEALLRRWIEASTDPGDLVIDPYMGSGTTLKVARDLGRRAIGIDSSEVAIETARKRLGLERAA